MNQTITRALNIAAALLVPFAVQTLFVIWMKSPRPTPLSESVELATPVVSAGAGFMFLVRGLGRLGLAAAVIYFPVVLWLLFYFTFIIVSVLFGDSI